MDVYSHTIEPQPLGAMITLKSAKLWVVNLFCLPEYRGESRYRVTTNAARMTEVASRPLER